MSDLISVESRFEKNGTVHPKAFEWKGRHYTVESVGRQWEEDGILHILVMVASEVFEISFNSSSMSWHLVRSPQDFGTHRAA